jgi:hypothetical protein
MRSPLSATTGQNDGSSVPRTRLSGRAVIIARKMPYREQCVADQCGPDDPLPKRHLCGQHSRHTDCRGHAVPLAHRQSVAPGSELPLLHARPRRDHHANQAAAGQVLTRAQRAANRRLARRPMRIEHVNSRVKRSRIVHDTNRLRKAGVRDLLMEICYVLHNFRVRLIPWQPMV